MKAAATARAITATRIDRTIQVRLRAGFFSSCASTM